MDTLFDAATPKLPPILGALIVAIIYGVNLAATRWTGRRKRQAVLGDGAVEKQPENPAVLESLGDFDWASAVPRSLRPFKPIYHITMGLKNDAPSELITIDRDYLDRISLRRGLIAQHGSTVHGCVSGGEGPVKELYGYLLTEYLPARFPKLFELSSDEATFRNLVTGKTSPTKPPADADAALRTLGETVEEDIFLLRQTPDGHQSVAFVCCFPSGFDPSAKLGRTLKDIHAPVPAYEKIGPSMERFFGKLEAGKSVKRVNWSIQTHPDLFNCKGNHITGDDAVQEDQEVDIEQTFLRCELQTASRLPKTGAILFSFKTYLYPMRELKEEGLGPQLADAIEGLQKGNAPGMWTYKSAVRWGKEVCKYLRA